MNDEQMMHYVSEINYCYEQNNNETRWTAQRIKPFRTDRPVVGASC